MACETAWVGSSFAPGPPSDWTVIHLPHVRNYSECEAVLRWCLQESTHGEFGFATASTWFDDTVSGSVWAFSDSNSAFEFKMRFF